MLLDVSIITNSKMKRLSSNLAKVTFPIRSETGFGVLNIDLTEFKAHVLSNLYYFFWFFVYNGLLLL